MPATDNNGFAVLPPPTSKLLAAFRLSLGRAERVTLEEISLKMRGRESGLLLLLLALPEVIPMIGLSVILAAPIFLVSLHMIFRGGRSAPPRWIGRRTVKRTFLEKAIDKTLPIFRRIEKVSRPRWSALALAGRPQGAIALLMSILLGIPLPGVNILAALAVAGIGLGILQRDGLIVSIAFFFSALALAAAAAVFFGAATLLKALA